MSNETVGFVIGGNVLVTLSGVLGSECNFL